MRACAMDGTQHRIARPRSARGLRPGEKLGFISVESDEGRPAALYRGLPAGAHGRSEEHTSELQSRQYLVCRLLPTTQIFTLSLHDALPICNPVAAGYSNRCAPAQWTGRNIGSRDRGAPAACGPGRSWVSFQWNRMRGGQQPYTAVCRQARTVDRKSTRLNSSHANISYAVFCRPPRSSLFPYTTLFRSVTLLPQDIQIDARLRNGRDAT